MAIQVMFWIALGVCVVSFIAFAAALSSFERANEPGATYSAYLRMVDQHNFAVGTTAAASLLVLPIAILLIIWTFKAHRAAALLQPGKRTWEIGWTIGAWFIPLAMYVIPFLVIRETDKISIAPRVDGRVVPNWRDFRWLSPLGAWWWTLYVLMIVVFVFRPAVLPNQGDESIVGDRAWLLLSLLMVALGGASSILGALYIRAVSRRLSPAAFAYQQIH